MFCVFHFLFITDGVDYKYGRGLKNPAAEWCHWSERLAWRIGILLPLHQKFARNYWRRCHPNAHVGAVIHWSVALWSIGFLSYQILWQDIPYFSQWAIGGLHHRR